MKTTFKVLAFAVIIGCTLVGCKSPSGTHTHTWSPWEPCAPTPATLVSEGDQERACSGCGETVTRFAALPIDTGAKWIEAEGLITGNTGNYTLNIEGSVGKAGSATATFGATPSGSLTITLKGSGKLYLTSQESLLRMGANQTLIIDGPVLEGLATGQNNATQNNNRAALYIETGGNFTMNGGTISANTSSSNGGGVYVSDGGKFTMNGGTISGNSTSGTSSGGGVYMVGSTSEFTMSGGTITGNTAGNSGGGVSANGTFTMEGGTISGNSAPSNFGGGVYVSNSGPGTFIMNGGIISGNNGATGGGVYISGTFYLVTGTIYGSNEADPALRNTNNSGTTAALYKGTTATAQRGTFTGPGDSWESKANLEGSISNTIKVVDGELQS